MSFRSNSFERISKIFEGTPQIWLFLLVCPYISRSFSSVYPSHLDLPSLIHPIINKDHPVCMLSSNLFSYILAFMSSCFISPRFISSSVKTRHCPVLSSNLSSYISFPVSSRVLDKNRIKFGSPKFEKNQKNRCRKRGKSEYLPYYLHNRNVPTCF